MKRRIGEKGTRGIEENEKGDKEKKGKKKRGKEKKGKGEKKNRRKGEKKNRRKGEKEKRRKGVKKNSRKGEKKRKSSKGNMLVGLDPPEPLPKWRSFTKNYFFLGEFIVGRVIKAMNAAWHPKCFCCEMCHKELADLGFVKNQGMIFLDIFLIYYLLPPIVISFIIIRSCFVP